jgi:AAA domain, putative AbiEii toxin, Type IV TA system/AAA ATPase domain
VGCPTEKEEPETTPLAMRYYLFIDNFRGFKDTVIPVSDVNFLVGENSTGKTSILGLIKLFAGPRFLMQVRPEFGDEHVNFGNFSDMVSRHSDDQEYFHIGIVRQGDAGKDGKSAVVSSLYTFVENRGRPRLSALTFCRGSQKLSLRLRGDYVRFKSDTYPTAPTIDDIRTSVLSEWKQEHLSKHHAAYAKLDTGGFPGRIPLLFVLGMIGSGLGSASSRKNRTEVTFEAPNMAVGEDVVWLAPIRTKALRTYDELTTEFSPEGAHIPYLIRRTLRSKKAAVKFKEFIHRIGESSGLFQDVLTRSYGRKETAPFEVDIVLDDKALNLSTVGYGVSQALPVLVELLDRPRGTWFAIQQPEVHLHPRAQAALGDVFFEMAANERKRFLVETHSDFTIDRFRMNYKRARAHKPDSQILFFERRDKHNVVSALAIGESGELSADQPESYRDFFVREEIRLLSVG